MAVILFFMNKEKNQKKHFIMAKLCFTCIFSACTACFLKDM